MQVTIINKLYRSELFLRYHLTAQFTFFFQGVKLCFFDTDEGHLLVEIFVVIILLQHHYCIVA